MSASAFPLHTATRVGPDQPVLPYAELQYVAHQLGGVDQLLALVNHPLLPLRNQDEVLREVRSRVAGLAAYTYPWAAATD